MVLQKVKAFKIMQAIEKQWIVVIATNRVYANIIFLKSSMHLAIGDIHRIWTTETSAKITDNQDIGTRYPTIYRIPDKRR
ncbi:hypothetical protein B7982_11440 [Fibrobacter sp. UWB2]|nr:hypothetical protein [Fibrobacter sp. UWB2]OWV21713.1 hypothetical protein B7982_11440 [Fibrobacter sp. UWB2]